MVKFRVRITFKKLDIITYIVVLSLLPFIAYFRIHLSSFIVYELDIIGAIFLTISFLMNSFSFPFSIQKSDTDFLFILPLDEKEVIIAFSLSTFFAKLETIIETTIFLFPAISYFSLLVVLLMSIMNMFSSFAFKGKRKILVPIIAVWMLFSLMKFPFTPLSMLFGYIYGYFILTTLSILVMFLGIRSVSVEDLINQFYKMQGLITDKATTSISLYSSSPLMAMLKKDFKFVEIRADNSRKRSIIINRRVNIHKVVIMTTTIAIAIYLGFPFFSHIKGINSQTLLSIYEGTIAFILGYFFIVFASTTAFANEPLWLNLSVMTPAEFARKYLLIKTLSRLIIFLPISISLILLNPSVGVGSLLIPLAYIYIASINARLHPERISSQIQIYDYNIRALIKLFLLFPSLILVALDVFLPIAGAIVTLLFDLPFLLSKNYWDKTFEKIITSL